jgi:hypothetical protein
MECPAAIHKGIAGKKSFARGLWCVALFRGRVQDARFAILLAGFRECDLQQFVKAIGLTPQGE